MEFFQYHDDGGMAVSSGLTPLTFEPGEIVSWGYGTVASPRHYGVVAEQISMGVVWVGYLDGSGFSTQAASRLRRTKYTVKETP